MAASRRKKKQRKEKFEKALTAVLCGIVAVLVLLAAVISLSEENGGALPTWQQLYSWFGVAAPVPHLPEEAAGAATKVHFIDVGRETLFCWNRTAHSHSSTQASGKQRTG